MTRERAGAWTVLCLMLTCCFAASAAQPPVTPNAQRLSAAEEQVLKFEDEWVAAEHNRDVAALRRILDDKFVVTFDGKAPVGKERFIQPFVSRAVDPTDSQTLTERSVIIDGDTAIVTGIDTERGTRNGSAYTSVARYTATYIRRNGNWLALAEHMVSLPQPK
jgi:ketosteroid isomerase-like protein